MLFAAEVANEPPPLAVPVPFEEAVVEAGPVGLDAVEGAFEELPVPLEELPVRFEELPVPFEDVPVPFEEDPVRPVPLAGA